MSDGVSKIEADAKAAAGWFDKHFPHRLLSNPPAPSASSQPGEQPMTTPQQSVVDSLHQLTGEIAANKLVSRLVQYGIGKRLTDAQADHLVTVIADMEQPPPQPQFTPHDDSAQYPADGQHQQVAG